MSVVERRRKWRTTYTGRNSLARLDRREDKLQEESVSIWRVMLKERKGKVAYKVKRVF